jgi:hypothetical protein
MEVHTIADKYDIPRLRNSVLAEIEGDIGSVSDHIILEPAITAHYTAHAERRHPLGAPLTHLLLQNCSQSVTPDKISIMSRSYVAFAADFLAEAYLWSCDDCQCLNVAPSLQGEQLTCYVCTARIHVCGEHRSPSCACMA